MEHNKNILNQKFPLIGKIAGFFLGIIAIVAAFEWNRVTGSYWGFLFLVIALPGLFKPGLKIFNRLVKNNSRRVG